MTDQQAMEIANLKHEVEKLRATVADYEHSINWHTTCSNCAGLLDRLYEADTRIELAVNHLMSSAEFGGDPDPDSLASILIAPRP